MVMNIILTILYLLMVVVIGVFTFVYMFQSKKLHEKITCGIVLALLILRLFLIKQGGKIMGSIKELFTIEKNKKNIIITSSILAGAIALGIVSGVQFKNFSDYETYFYVRENIEIENL